ncbi:hypothetical protein BGX26_008418 [Mortierella sp. AD094]|nr:hypothetical protein BGX26_008418 [Mortierella sp. AD094]
MAYDMVKYGSFSSKLKSGSTGPGIVTAFLLSNPALGEQISFELTGKNPKKVITNYHRRVPAVDADSKKPQDPFNAVAQSGLHHRLESHEETHELKHDTTKHELVYKSSGMSELFDGHAAETTDWAGGKTFYDVDNSKEYVASVSAVEIACGDSDQSLIACQNPSEGNKPWPGPEATNRLQHTQIKATTGTHGYREIEVASTKSFFKISILSLIKWSFVLLSLICGAAYFTEPKTKARSKTSASLSTPTSMGSARLRT